MPQLNDMDCFGLYNASETCQRCNIFKECRYVCADGVIDAIATAMDIMVGQLPEGMYEDPDDKYSKMVSCITGQIIPKPVTQTVDPSDPDNIPDFSSGDSTGKDAAWTSVMNKIKNNSAAKK